MLADGRTRKAAVDALDEAALEATDRDLAAVRRKIELQESAIIQLRAAQTEAADAEARESFLSEVAEYQADAAELANRIEDDYPTLAAATGAILEDLRTLAGRAQELEKRAEKLGVSVPLRNPKTFDSQRRRDTRRLGRALKAASPKARLRTRRAASCDGSTAYTAAREGVAIITRRSEPLESLLATVGNLPHCIRTNRISSFRGQDPTRSSMQYMRFLRETVIVLAA